MNEIPSIEDSISWPENGQCFPNVDQRYLTKFRSNSAQSSCVLLHSNRICLVALAKDHPALKDGQKISKVDFQAGYVLQHHIFLCTVDSAYSGHIGTGLNQWLLYPAVF